MQRLCRAGALLSTIPLLLTLALFLALPLFVSLSVRPAAADIRRNPDPAWQRATSVEQLVGILDTWIDSATDLPRNHRAVSVEFVSASRARALWEQAYSDLDRLRGLYDPTSATIYLVQPFSMKVARDVSVLLHELVHHRQATLHWYCDAAQEPAAYFAQEAWLAERGIVLEWPRLAILLAAGCGPRDIHPD